MINNNLERGIKFSKQSTSHFFPKKSNYEKTKEVRVNIFINVNNHRVYKSKKKKTRFI